MDGSSLGTLYIVCNKHQLSFPVRKHQDAKKEEEKKKQPHIKKPLNAFMLYMKEMRAKVVAECTLKESAAINQILGRRVSLHTGSNYIPALCLTESTGSCGGYI